MSFYLFIFVKVQIDQMDDLKDARIIWKIKCEDGRSL